MCSTLLKQKEKSLCLYQYRLVLISIKTNWCISVNAADQPTLAASHQTL